MKTKEITKYLITSCLALGLEEPHAKIKGGNNPV
jgi:hypothetical protein